MSIEVLNTELVTAKIKENGWTRNWLINELGLGREGYPFLRGEWLPKDAARKTSLVRKLAKKIGVDVSQVLLRIDVTKAIRAQAS